MTLSLFFVCWNISELFVCQESYEEYNKNWNVFVVFNLRLKVPFFFPSNSLLVTLLLLNDQIICRLVCFALDLRLTLFSVLSIMHADQVGNFEVDLEKFEYLC